MILSTDQIRRRKSICVTFALLAEIFKGYGTQIVAWRGIPRDARLVGIDLDHSLEVVELIFEHESFPKVCDGIDVLPTQIDSKIIYPETFCGGCREEWREILDRFYALENDEMERISPK